MKRTIILLAAALALWAQAVQAQTWQPTTWPPPPVRGCTAPQVADAPDLCNNLDQMRVGFAAADYALANQKARGYGVDVPADVEGAFTYGERQMQQWNQQTGRYDNEAWMWQPAPQNQQQWQQRRQGGR